MPSVLTSFTASSKAFASSWYLQTGMKSSPCVIFRQTIYLFGCFNLPFLVSSFQHWNNFSCLSSDFHIWCHQFSFLSGLGSTVESQSQASFSPLVVFHQNIHVNYISSVILVFNCGFPDESGKARVEQRRQAALDWLWEPRATSVTQADTEEQHADRLPSCFPLLLRNMAFARLSLTDIRDHHG